MKKKIYGYLFWILNEKPNIRDIKGNSLNYLMAHHLVLFCLFYMMLINYFGMLPSATASIFITILFFVIIKYVFKYISKLI